LFEISDDAMEFILSSLEAAMEGRPELRKGTTRVGLRLIFKPNGAHLSLSFPRPVDQVMTFMGRTLLIVDPGDFSRLDRTRLTVEQGVNGKSLSMKPSIPERVA
jgi:hypothetical protein